MRIISETTHEQFENGLNKLIDYVVSFDKEYKENDNHSEFEQGQHLAYYTILDTVKNQLNVDGIELDEDLEKICNDVIFEKREDS